MKLVFIGACPRSGTTMLASMLGHSPHTITIPEGAFKFIMLHKLNAVAPITEAYLFKVLTSICNHYSFKNWEIDLDIDATIKSIDYKKVIFPQVYQRLIEQYIKIHWPEKALTAHWVIDHDPSNCKYGSALSSNFSESYFIHLIRDGRGVTTSVLPLDWGPNEVFSASLFWMTNLSYGFASEQMFKNRFVRLRYEDVVNDPNSHIQAVCKTFAIPFENSMIMPQGLKVPGYTRNQHLLIGKNINPKQIDYWKNQLSKQEVAIFEKETFELLPMLGYALTTTKANISTVIKIKYKLEGLLKTYFNRVKKRHREIGV